MKDYATVQGCCGTVTQSVHIRINNSSFLWFTSCLFLLKKVVHKVVPRVTLPIYYSLPSGICWLAHLYTQGMFIEHLSTRCPGEFWIQQRTKQKSLPSDCVQCGVRTSWCASQAATLEKLASHHSLPAVRIAPLPELDIGRKVAVEDGRGN